MTPIKSDRGNKAVTVESEQNQQLIFSGVTGFEGLLPLKTNKSNALIKKVTRVTDLYRFLGFPILLESGESKSLQPRFHGLSIYSCYSCYSFGYLDDIAGESAVTRGVTSGNKKF
jgi:hypothetical protein